MLTAGEVAGSFEGAVEARASDVSLVATATVTISPGPLEQVRIAPESVKLGMEMTQQFVAAGADKFGNRISGLKFTWRLVRGGGTLDSIGLFTAGSDPGTYADTVKVTVSHGNEVKIATITVSVQPDRIAFLSKRNAKKLTDVQDLYIMNSDGSNVIRITKSGAVDPSWSPDGRRIAYDRGGVLYAINAEENLAQQDVDNWRASLLSARFRADDPVWSPDGTKMVFQSFEHADDNVDNPGSEIYVMDIDGGNRIRLTDNSYRDDKPSWSPDGSKITFISDSEGDGEEQIYVIDADGSNLRRVSNGGENSNPKWSPDGTQIVYQARPSSRDWWALSIIDSRINVGGGRNITSPETGDYNPSWTPDSGRILFWSYRDSEFRSSKTGEERDKGAEIYTMDRTGRDVRRLTNNEVWDGFPVWAPRRAGVEVGDSSIIFPNASRLKALSVREVTSKASPAVVRIKTNRGSGSGFIIGSDGIILTNNHVIQDAQKITVFLGDGSDYPGTVLGRDMVRDLAKIKIEASDLPVLAFGDLSNVSQGQQIVVLGFPLGNTSLSVTSGFVSSILFDPGRNMRFIQTDSDINSGNSGGPLLNLQGQVVGVVSSRVVGTNIEGLGRAISANTVKVYLDGLQEREIIKPAPVSEAAVKPSGAILRTLASSFIALDDSGAVYVTDTANHRVQKFDRNGRFWLMWGAQGSSNGQFESPRGIIIDRGAVYVVDTGNHRIQKFAPDGRFVTKWGTKGSLDGQFNSPTGIAADGTGMLYVTDTVNHRIQKFDKLGQFVGTWGSPGSRDGQLDSPRGIVVDESRRVYVADTGNSRIQRFDPIGNFMLKWGIEGSQDGQFQAPRGIALTGTSVYVADTRNHRIQRFDMAGRFMFKWGTEGTGEGELSSPGGIAVDESGNFFVADIGNHRVQRFSTSGKFGTAWGTEGRGEGQFS
jgi:S1-C subfamily serine protease/Tol biopolymer transport system component/streptogramin lyase